MKMRMTGVLIVAAAMALFGNSLVSANDAGVLPHLKVTFLDGSSVDLEKASFVYQWSYRSDAQYFNRPYHQTRSKDIHYVDIVHNVTLDRVLPGAAIKKIDLSWKPESGGDYFAPVEIRIDLVDGKSIVLKSLEVASGFLLNKPIDKIEDEADFRELTLDGIAKVEGQKGKFSGRIFANSGVHLEAKEVIKTLIFMP